MDPSETDANVKKRRLDSCGTDAEVKKTKINSPGTDADVSDVPIGEDNVNEIEIRNSFGTNTDGSGGEGVDKIKTRKSSGTDTLVSGEDDINGVDKVETMTSPRTNTNVNGEDDVDEVESRVSSRTDFSGENDYESGLSDYYSDVTPDDIISQVKAQRIEILENLNSLNNFTVDLKNLDVRNIRVPRSKITEKADSIKLKINEIIAAKLNSDGNKTEEDEDKSD